MPPEFRAWRRIYSGHPDPYREDERWIHVRIVGWTLIGVWQVLSLASEFVPIDLGSRSVRIVAKITGLAGLILVAYGFERLAHIGLQRARGRDK